MSDELGTSDSGVEPDATGETTTPQPRRHAFLYVVGLALTLFGLIAAKSMYGDGNHVLAFFVLGMLAIVWVELAAIYLRDRRYNQRLTNQAPDATSERD